MPASSKREKRTHLVNILTFEHRLRDLALATYKAWLPAAQAAVMPTAWVASVFDEPLPPNPDGILSTQQDWEKALDDVFIHGLGQIMGRQVIAYIGATGAVPAAEEFRNAYLNDVRNRMVKTPDSVWGEISRDLAEGIDKGETPEELQKRVQQHLDANNLNLYRNRADNVARTEAAGAYNGARYQAAMLEAAAYGDVIDAVWISTIDGKTRRSHVAADGQRVRVGTPFRVGGHALRWPGDPRGPAAEVCRCRCAVSFLDADDPLPEETDRHTERGPGATTVKNRSGLTKEQQIQLWREQGILRARDDPDGIGRTDATTPPPRSPQDVAASIRRDAEANEPSITATVSDAFTANSAQARREDTRLKTPASIEEKLERMAKRGMPPSRLTDAVRYTAVIDEGDYWQKGNELIRDLERAGFELVDDPRGWNSKGYRGRNVVMRSGNQLFEVQIHTPASLDAAERAHTLYEQERAPGTGSSAKKRLKRQQAELFENVPWPPSVPKLD